MRGIMPIIYNITMTQYYKKNKKNLCGEGSARNITEGGCTLKSNDEHSSYDFLVMMSKSNDEDK